MSFVATQLGFAYGLHDATFQFPRNGLISIAGPNGAGKSTLLGMMAGLRSPYSGSCTYDGKEIRQWPKREFARKVAFLPQSVRMQFPFTVEEVVLMGRTPYASGWFQTAEDRSAVEDAMTTTDTLAFRARDFRSLSGGEAQRVILASALTQRPEALLLDEPATHLDLRHQLALYKLLGELSKSLLVVAVTHDLNLALRFSHRVMVLEDGRVAADGTAEEVLNPALIARVFGVQATLHGTWMSYEG
ncbi:MAG TPA: ABC transporter ATP-binding protein [Bryobacteraceae bacterium]|jgi:iron complex transport system ATP-binding protein|nr:ABC transporter ATP-binding protein [Bryobacteraceae bacterium]